MGGLLIRGLSPEPRDWADKPHTLRLLAPTDPTRQIKNSKCWGRQGLPKPCSAALEFVRPQGGICHTPSAPEHSLSFPGK